MSFNIAEFLEFDDKGRTICPSCRQIKGPQHKNLNLSLLENSAYHCFAGCTPEQIRQAIGQPKGTGIIPTNIARPPKPPTLTRQQVEEHHSRLIEKPNSLAMQWLNNRGFTLEMIQHFHLGIFQLKLNQPYWCISIPLTAGEGYHHKLRVSPWLNHNQMPWYQKGLAAQVWFTHTAPGASQTWLCEGEWDAMMLGWLVRNSDEKDYIQVCCFTCGAGVIPPDPELEKLTGKVVIWYDLDSPGQEGAIKLARKLGQRARIATVPHPELPPKGWDISDALNHSFTLADLLTAAHAATLPTSDKEINKLEKNMVSYAQLAARAADYVDFLIPDILTYELYVLVAPPRGGKSLLMMGLAQAIATGSRFLDRPVTQGSVLIINLEDSEAKVKERAIAMGWTTDIPVYWLNDFKLEQIEQLGEVIDGFDDLRLVIIDTLARAKTAKVSESSAEMSQLLEPLQIMANDKGVAILLTHHTGKLNIDNLASVDIFDQIRGSSAIRATCRGAWMIASGENSYRLVSENGHCKEDLNIRLDPTDLTWKLIGRWAPKIDGGIKEQILEALRLFGSATVVDLATATNNNPKSVATTLGRLQADDMVTKKGGWKGKPAVYARIQYPNTLDNLFENPNADTEGDTGDTPINKDNIFFSNTPPCQQTDKSALDPPPHTYGDKHTQILTGQGEFLPTTFPTSPTFGRNEPILYRDRKGWQTGSYYKPAENSLYSITTKKMEASHFVYDSNKLLIRVAEPDLRRGDEATE